MSARVLALALAVALLVLVPGCTFVGLWKIPIGTCNEGANCEILNTQDGLLPSDCQRWTCGANSRCVIAARDLDGDHDPDPACDPSATDCDDGDRLRSGTRTEECDGVDNDCDQIVDEQSGDDPMFARPMIADLASLMSTERVGYSGSASGELGVLAGNGATEFVAVRDGSSSGALDVAHAAQPPPPCVTPPCTSGQINDTTLAPGNACPIRSGEFFQSVACNTADAAIDRLGESWITASVSTSGCASGRVLVGPLVSEVDPRILLRGPVGRSNTWLGVDVGDGRASACTGESRPGTTTDRLGAARPAIAGLATSPHPQALVGWLADSVERPDACGQPPVNVELLAVQLETGSPGATTWVTGAGDGIPSVLGTTTGGAPPSIAALQHDGVPDGWLVAYAGTTGVQMHFVTPMTGTFPAAPMLQAQADTQRTMPNFMASAVLPQTFQGDRIRMAVGSYASGNYTLGVVYDRCDGSIAFGRAIVSPGAGSVTFSAPVALGPGRDPSIVYVADGFVTEGFERSGMLANGRRGGWVVSYATNAGIRAMRLLELDGLPLDAEPYVLSASASDARPTLYSAPGTSLARVAYIDSARSVLVGGNALCQRARE